MRLLKIAFSIALASALAVVAVIIGVGMKWIRIKNVRPSYLWKINSSPPSYLFGTIHVPYTLVWDSLPEVPIDFVAAFSSTNQAYFELDIKEMQEQKDILASCFVLPSDQDIAQVWVKINMCPW